MSAVASRFSVHVEQIDGFEFRVKFDKEQFAPLLLDEPPPLGRDTAPNAARVLAAAIGNCLSASLVFCLKRAKVAATGVTADVDVEIVRNESAAAPRGQSERHAPHRSRAGRSGARELPRHVRGLLHRDPKREAGH